MINNSFNVRYKKLPIAISQSANCDTEVHNHNEFEILYIEKGSSEVTISGKTFTALEGGLVFVNPMQVHSVVHNKNAEYRHKCICFDTSIISSLGLGKALKEEVFMVKNHLPATTPITKEVSQFFINVYNACANEDEIFEMEVTSFITLIFARLIKQGLVEKQNVNTKNDFCSLVINYVKNHYSENVTSKQASNALNFNQSYFCRNFKKNFGSSFSQYLNAYRISLSRKFLEDGDKNITQIAYDVGFSSPASFSKSFKAQLGILPSEYRK